MTVFYDAYEQASLWGKDLSSHLDTIYRKNARYCIVLISEAYVRKSWTRYEIRSALARAIESADSEYLLPVRIDDTDVPGVPLTVAYLDARLTTPEEIVHLLGEKVGARAEPGDKVMAKALLDVAAEAAMQAAVTSGVYAFAGMTLSGRYRLERLIATNVTGQVWEAVDGRLGRRVAVKVLKARWSSDPEFAERFRAEARMTAMLNHPGIAGIYDYGEIEMVADGRTAYLVMELVSGEPLNLVLARSGRLTPEYALDILEQAGWALQAAHSAGLVHRDIKPGSIVITPTGQVKITDFGIATGVDASGAKRTGMVMGTAQYIAPETALGHQATAASDVYSLGVVAYEALAGVPLFTGDGALTIAMKHIKEPPPPLPSDLPPNVRELIEITLAKKPSMRYASGGPFAEAVAMVRAGERPPRPDVNETLF